jgi:hypothetical protein
MAYQGMAKKKSKKVKKRRPAKMQIKQLSGL